MVAEWTELREPDQIAYWIGRVSRLDTNMDVMLHSIFENLLRGTADAQSGLSWAVVPPMVGGKLSGIRKMIKASGRDSEEVRRCMEAIAEIEAAHQLRNNAVHGHWSITDRPGVFNLDPVGSDPRPRPSVSWDVGEFEKCHIALQRAMFITTGLFKTVNSWFDPYTDEGWLLQAREELAGAFELTNFDDSAGGASASIRFPRPGVEQRLVELHALRRAKWDEEWRAQLDAHLQSVLSQSDEVPDDEPPTR
jgi:hypothetical protein